jgi:hypothetical protein
MYSFDALYRHYWAGLKEKSIRVGKHTISYLEGGKGETVGYYLGFIG